MAEVISGAGSDYSARTRDETAVVQPFWTKTSWGAIMAGALTAISAQLLFTILGVAIGATAADSYDVASASASDAGSVGIAAALWWLVTGTIALLLGGMVLGRVAGLPKSTEVRLHGLTMWAVTAVFGFAVIWSGAGISSNAGGMYGAAMNSNSSGIMGGAMSGRAESSNAGAAGGISDTIGRVTGTGADNGRSIDLATAERARRYARNAAWWSVFGLLLGIAASVIGASLAASDRMVINNRVKNSDAKN